MPDRAGGGVGLLVDSPGKGNLAIFGAGELDIVGVMFNPDEA
jgi:hypothetical protein